MFQECGFCCCDRVFGGASEQVRAEAIANDGAPANRSVGPPATSVPRTLNARHQSLSWQRNIRCTPRSAPANRIEVGFVTDLRCIYGPNIIDKIAARWLNHRVEVSGRVEWDASGRARLMKVALCGPSMLPTPPHNRLSSIFLMTPLKKARVQPRICPTHI